MQHGSKMIKLDVNRKGHAKKTFTLDSAMEGIRYQPSKKNSRCKLVNSEPKLEAVAICLQTFAKWLKHSYKNRLPQSSSCLFQE